jgi:hypothetical protein
LATETQEFTLDHLYELIESGDMNIDAFISSFDVQSRLAIYGSMAQAYVWEGQRMTDQQLTLLVAGVAYDNEAHELIGLLAETQQLGANDNILLFHPEIIDRGIHCCPAACDSRGWIRPAATESGPFRSGARRRA